MNLEGKVAIITGGFNGIGKAVSKELLNNGLKLLVCDIDENGGKLFLEEVPAALKSNVIYQRCDVSSYDQFKAAFEKAKTTFGKIDVVINNAGVVNEINWKKTIDINLIGVIHGLHLAFEFMGTNNGGSGGVVINTASVAGFHGLEFTPIYSACKHGVVGLTRSYGTPFHYDKTGVTVNAVCPGPVDTQMFHGSAPFSLDETEAKIRKAQLKSIGPDEVAKAFIQVLISGKNGQLLKVDPHSELNKMIRTLGK